MQTTVYKNSLKALSCMVRLGLLFHSASALTLTKPVQPYSLQRDSDKIGHIYYVDSKTGNDYHTGHTPALAWKSLAKLNANVFIPGDKILFKSRQTWMGNCILKGLAVKISRSSSSAAIARAANQ